MPETFRTGPPPSPRTFFEVFLGASREETSMRDLLRYLFHGRAELRCGSFPHQGCGGPSRAPAALAGGNFLPATVAPFASTKSPALEIIKSLLILSVFSATRCYGSDSRLIIYQYSCVGLIPPFLLRTGNLPANKNPLKSQFRLSLMCAIYRV